MQIARIADLLDPFLRAPASPDPPLPESRPVTPSHADLPAPCHSEPANAGEEPAVLSPPQLQAISTYIDILVRWNARINLTAIRDPEDVVTRHFGESLFAARHLFPGGESGGRPGGKSGGRPGGRPGGRAALEGRVTRQEEMRALAPETLTVADIGSGAGFPGLPIKLWVPHLSLTLIESNHKKAAFLREVIRALTLTDVNIQNTRAESVTGSFDVVTLRAVEHFAAILPTAAARVAPSGCLALLISAPQEAQARATLPHLSWSTPTPIPLSRSRIILVATSPAGSPPEPSL